MPEREQYSTEYEVPLPPFALGCWLRYRINPGPGRVAGFVIQLEYQDGDRTYPIVRYDCAHQQPHKDTLDVHGLVVAKEWLPYTYDRALAEAEQDLLANWQTYRAEFLRRIG